MLRNSSTVSAAGRPPRPRMQHLKVTVLNALSVRSEMRNPRLNQMSGLSQDKPNIRTQTVQRPRGFVGEEKSLRYVLMSLSGPTKPLSLMITFCMRFVKGPLSRSQGSLDV